MDSRHDDKLVQIYKAFINFQQKDVDTTYSVLNLIFGEAVDKCRGSIFVPKPVVGNH